MAQTIDTAESPLSPRLVLGSTSPRRLELLGQLGVVPARICAPDIDETPRRAEKPRDYALRMAKEKAHVITLSPGEVVLTGDTVVSAGRRILPRAATPGEVAECLFLLSGRRHHVMTAIATMDADGHLRTRLVDSIVAFAPLTGETISAYATSGDGIGKAGGYAIQGGAGAFVRWMSGSYSAIVGLPLFDTRALLITAGFPLV